MRSPTGLVKVQTSSGSTAGRLTVPAEFVREIDPDTLFRPEWHEDGILYAVVDPSEIQPPRWAKGGDRS